jgi:PadR family transcriptional regulator AphA
LVLRYAILGLLAEMPRSGYDLAQAFKTSLAYSWSAQHSQIYPELARMVDDGLIVGGERGSRRRRIYALTDAGRAALRRWLIEGEPDRRSRNEASLRLFLIWTLPTSEQIAYLEHETEYHRATLAELEQIGRFMEATQIPSPYRLMLEWGYRFHRAWLDWIAWAQNEIRAGRGPEAGVVAYHTAKAMELYRDEQTIRSTNSI